jgi:hypothetical protein
LLINTGTPEANTRLKTARHKIEFDMANVIRQRVTSIKEGAKEKRKLSGWIIPKEKSSFGDEDAW